MLVHKFNKYSDIPGSKSLYEKIPIFATQNYADYLREIKNYSTVWFAFIENNTVSFLLPFATNKKLIFRKGYFITGVLSLDPGNTAEKEKEFIEKVIIHIKKNKLCDWIQQGPNWALFNTFPSGSKTVKFGTYRISLNNRSEDELFGAIRRTVRGDIKNAIKSGIKIKKGPEYLNDCLPIIDNTAEGANLSSLSLTEAKKMLFYFKENLKILTSYKEDIPQSGAVLIGNKYCVYGLYSGSIKGLFRGSNTFLIWEAIKDAKNNGCEYFDFVGARIDPLPGSKQERIQQFKKHFGAELMQGYLWKMNFSIIKYNLYLILVRIIFLLRRKKYIPDIIDQELKRMKNLNN